MPQTVTVNVHEAKTTLSRLLAQVEAGDRVVIARAGTPIADLVPHRRPKLVLGTATGTLRYETESFDEPDESIAAMFDEV